MLKLEETRFKSAEGDWQVDGTIAPDGGPTFDLDVKVAHARVETLVQSFSKNGKASRIFGIMDGQATLHGRGKESAAWEKTLHGSGQVSIRDGRLPSFNIFQSVIHAVLGLFARILPVGKIGSLSEPSMFQRFDQAFRIEGGRVRTENLALITDDYHLSGRGSFGLDTTLDYQTVVSLTPQGTQKMVTVASVPILSRSFDNLKPIPVRVTGTLAKPVILPDASVLPLATLRGLLGGGGATGTVGDVVEGGAQAVREGVGRLLGKSPREESPPSPESPPVPEMPPSPESPPGPETPPDPETPPEDAPPQQEPERGDLLQQGLEGLRQFLDR
jgi:hypothetical protein